MKTRVGAGFIALLLAGCAANSFVPPPITPALAERGRADHATAQQLSAGRTLYVTRCLECHTLPRTTDYSRRQWPDLVSRMASRAALTPEEVESVTAYLRAASAR